MFESAADNSSILSIDLGLLIGFLVLQRLLDPSADPGSDLVWFDHRIVADHVRFVALA
jgi:hypothetical protein